MRSAETSSNVEPIEGMRKFCYFGNILEENTRIKNKIKRNEEKQFYVGSFVILNILEENTRIKNKIK